MTTGNQGLNFVLQMKMKHVSFRSTKLRRCCKLSEGVQRNSYCYHQPYLLSSNSSFFSCLSSPLLFTSSQNSTCTTHLSCFFLAPCRPLAMWVFFFSGWNAGSFSSFLQAPLYFDYVVKSQLPSNLPTDFQAPKALSDAVIQSHKASTIRTEFWKETEAQRCYTIIPTSHSKNGLETTSEFSCV